MSAVIWAFLYYFVSKIEKSSINFLTPALFTFFPTCYFFEFIYVCVAKNSLSLAGYVYFFSLYSIAFFSLTIGYLFSVFNNLVIVHRSSLLGLSQLKITRCYIFLLVISTLLGFILYLPILIEFKEFIMNPRRIYELTRTGYGVPFFLSNLFSLLSIMFCFYTYKYFKWTTAVLFIVSTIIIYLHGSKTAILSIFFIFVLYNGAVKHKSYNLIYVLSFVFIIASVMFFFFWFTFNIEPAQVFLAMAGYSDYTRNAIVLYERNYDFQMGRLLFETEFFSRIPRVMFPQKPDDFGYLELAKTIFPDAFYLNQGAPSFGFGNYYADFGYLTHAFILVIYSLKGVLIGVFRNQLKKDSGVYFFIPFIFLSGVELLTLGTGWLFFEHVFLSAFIFLCMYLFMRLNNVYSKSF